jgi:peptide subunit release factor 1 (eRF1)
LKFVNLFFILFIVFFKKKLVLRIATILPRNSKQLAMALRSYAQRVGQAASQIFVEDGNPIIQHLILGGTYELKDELVPSILSDTLKPIYLRTVDIRSASEEEFTKV